MKKASRFMPRFNHQKTGFWGWSILCGISCVFTWLLWYAPLLLLILPVIALFLYLERKKEKKYFQNLLAKRQGLSICDFSRYFDCKEIDTWVIRAVYEQLQEYLKPRSSAFPVLPSDDVFADLKFDDEDFEYDIVEEIAFRTGRSLDGAESNPYYGKANIVKNLVYFFNNQPMKNAT